MKETAFFILLCFLSSTGFAENLVPETRFVSIVSTSPNIGISSEQIIATHVAGRHCISREEPSLNYQKAMQDALSAWPAANALMDVKAYLLKRTFGSDCIEVRGNAVRL